MRLYVLVALLGTIILSSLPLHAAKGSKQVPLTTPAKVRIAILDEDLPGSDKELPKALQSALTEKAEVSLVSADDLARGLSTEPAGYDMVIFPDAPYLPANVKDPLMSFLKRGGDMIAIGGPAFSAVVSKTGGQWTGNEKDKATQTDPNSPVLESLSPAYQTYKLSAAKLTSNKVYEDWGFSDDIAGPVDVVSPIWRPRGFGIVSEHTFRWVPLLFAVDEKGERRGTAAAITINNSPDFPDSVWGYIGFSGEPYRNAIVSGVSRMVARISTGAFLMNAGMSKFGYFENDKGAIGADVLWTGRLKKPMLKLRTISALGPTTYEEDVHINLARQVAATAPIIRRTRDWRADYVGRFYARVDLYDGDKAIDTLFHDFSVVSSSRQPSSVVTAKDGDFYLDGKKWYPIGVNYWPRYISGSNAGLDWLSPSKYDPEIVEKDLTQIEGLGMNEVSIQFMRKSETSQLVDFLDRCRRHNLKANIFVAGLNPLLDKNRSIAIDMIEAARLPQNDTVFAYDLAWEPIIGPEADRKQWNGDWTAWILERYGSLDGAFKDWAYTPQMDGNLVVGPTDKQLTDDGEWRTMVAAYRRFWDDTLSRRYGSVVTAIRKVDTVHLAGARSGYGGTGNPNVAARMPFDLASGAKHLDFISPESWNLHADGQGVLEGGINTAYAHLVSNGKPVFWAEFGYSIWPQEDASKMAKQADFFRSIYEMVSRSGANGAAAWWWPGGFRVGEGTDMGITYPDGTSRPAALEAKKFTPSKAGSQVYWITIDRDEHVDGYAGVFTSKKEEYAGALSRGENPKLKTAGTGTTSLTAPKLAVGDKPLTGSNPPKFLNAELNAPVQVKTGRGVWIEPKQGQVIHVGKGKPVQVKLSVGNIAETEWLALPADQEGAVTLTATTSTGETHKIPIPQNVPMFGDVTFDAATVVPGVKEKTTITLQMEAIGRSVFGPKVQFVAAP